MRVLPDVVDGRPRRRSRLLLAAGTAAVAVAALAGCAHFASALGQRRPVVPFTANAPRPQRMAVRRPCAKPPNVSPQPLPSNLKSAYELPQVTYQINKASNADVATLETCL